MACPFSKLLPGPNAIDLEGCKQWCEFAVKQKGREDEFECLFWVMKRQLDEILERLDRLPNSF